MVSKNKSHISFVASGGGTKAWFFHAGVAMALEEKGVVFRSGLKTDPFKSDSPYICDRYVGSSGGALFCTLLASGFSPAQQVDVFGKNGLTVNPRRLLERRRSNGGYSQDLYKFSLRKGLAVNRRLISDYLTALKHTDRLQDGRLEALAYWLASFSSPLSSRKIANYLKEVLPSDDFRELAVDLNVVTTINDPSQKIYRMIFSPDEYVDPRAYCAYKNSVPISQAVAASCALPGFFTPYTLRVDGVNVDLVDGEIRKTLSTHVAKDKIVRDKKASGSTEDRGLIIGSFTHMPYHYNARYGRLRKFGLPLNLQQAIYILVSSKIDLFRRYNDVKVVVNDEVVRFFREKGYPEKDLENFLEALNEKIEHDPKINYLYVMPDPKDAGFFMGGNHFDFTTKGVMNAVEKGYESANRMTSRYSLESLITKGQDSAD
jgi:predicted acylesterase/phospholipase RssA